MTREEAIEVLKRDIHNAKVTHHLSEHYEMAIKALEQEPCEDAISRQAVLDELRTCFDTHSIYDENNGENYIIYEDAVDMMEKLPSVTPTRKKWIPVSERLPEEGVDVLACFYTEEKNYKTMVSRRSDYNYWNGVGRTSDMVAWMPLPDPYKAEMESEK